MRVALDKKRFRPWALVTGASSVIGRIADANRFIEAGEQTGKIVVTA